MSLSNRWAVTETPQCFSVLWWMWPEVTQSVVSVFVVVSLFRSIFIFLAGLWTQKVTHSLSMVQNLCVCSEDRSKGVEHTTLLSFVNSSHKYASVHTKTPWTRKESLQDSRAEAYTDQLHVVCVCVFDPFSLPLSFSLSLILFGLVAFPFPNSSSYQSTDWTSQHTHKLHIQSSSHTNSFVFELRESRCTWLFTSVCVLSKCERSVADSADSEHLIGSVEQIQQQFIRSVGFLGSHSVPAFRSKNTEQCVCGYCVMDLSYSKTWCYYY